MTVAAPYRRTLEADFQVAVGLERDFLGVDPWVVRRGMPLEAADEKKLENLSDHRINKKKMERVGAVDLERVDVFRVVAPRE